MPKLNEPDPDDVELQAYLQSSTDQQERDPDWVKHMHDMIDQALAEGDRELAATYRRVLDNRGRNPGKPGIYHLLEQVEDDDTHTALPEDSTTGPTKSQRSTERGET